MATRRATPDAPDGGDAGTEDAGTVDESRVRDIVRDVLSELHLTGGDGGDTPDGDDGDGGDEQPSGRRSQADVEGDVESRVRSAIEKLRTEEDRDQRLSALESKLAEAPPERAPIKERVSTRLMGWNRGSAR